MLASWEGVSFLFDPRGRGMPLLHHFISFFLFLFENPQQNLRVIVLSIKLKEKAKEWLQHTTHALRLTMHSSNTTTTSRPRHDQSKTPHKNDQNTEAAPTNVPQLKHLEGVGDGEWMDRSDHSG
jgi:hypothetical protein